MSDWVKIIASCEYSDVKIRNDIKIHSMISVKLRYK